MPLMPQSDEFEEKYDESDEDDGEIEIGKGRDLPSHEHLDKVAGASADPVKDYLKQIGRVSLLTAEEEKDLSERIEAGLYAQHILDTAEESVFFPLYAISKKVIRSYNKMRS